MIVLAVVLIVAGVFLAAQLVIAEHDREQVGARALRDALVLDVESSRTGANYILVIRATDQPRRRRQRAKVIPS